MSDRVILFLNSISLECPACFTETYYRRDGYDGINGEGQYCKTCAKYVVQAGMRYITVERNNPKEIDEWKQKVKYIYENS